MAKPAIILPITGNRSELVALRLGKNNVASHAQSNGNLEVDLYPVDSNALKFQANVLVHTVAAGQDFTFTPCNESGDVITFNSVDDVINFINTAYVELIDVKVRMNDFASINTNVTLVRDPVKDKLAKKARFTKLHLDIADRVALATVNEQAALTLGWNTSPYPAYTLQYADLLAKKVAVLAMQTFYAAQVIFYS